jgi:deazaflavin-dependent oxidoreductase (nitroreductase family)
MLRLALRLPVVLYRLHLGWLLGHRFVLLTHRGRRTGRVRQTLLEVVHYDRRTGECIVAAGWGEQAEWYRNLRAHPALSITIGRRRYAPVQRFLTVAEAEATLRDYQRQHPMSAWAASHLLGIPIDRVAPLPMVAFQPPAASIAGGRTTPNSAEDSPSPTAESDKRGEGAHCVSRSFRLRDHVS